MKPAKLMTKGIIAGLSSLLLVVGMAWPNNVSASVPGVNERVSVDASGNQISSVGTWGGDAPAISRDGRYIVFESDSSQLVSGDTNGLLDVFVKDRQTGSVVRANTTPSGTQMTTGEVIGTSPAVSDDGRFVAFLAYEPGLVSGYAGTHRDVYVKDMQTGAIDVSSVSSSGSAGDGDAASVALSANGRYVVFSSAASNLVPGDTNSMNDIFVRDRQNGATTLVSKSYTGGVANGGSMWASISCDGAYVAFSSAASDLVASDTNSNGAVFLADRITGDMTDITLNENGYATGSAAPQVSCDGTTVVFDSTASNLVSGDTNGYEDIFAYDVMSHVIDRITVSSSGGQSTRYPDEGFSTRSVSYDGQYVVYSAYDNGLVSSDTNSKDDVYLRDRKNGTTQLISMRSVSTPAVSDSYYPSISEDGKYVGYISNDSNLVAGDTNSEPDIFVSQTGI